MNAGELWPPDAEDPELVEALAAPTDFDRLFAVALNALVDALVPRRTCGWLTATQAVRGGPRLRALPTALGGSAGRVD